MGPFRQAATIPSAAAQDQTMAEPLNGLSPECLASSGIWFRVQSEAWGGRCPPHQPVHLMMGLKRMSRVLMNMVGCTMYRALIFFLYLQRDNRNSAAGVVGEAQS